MQIENRSNHQSDRAARRRLADAILAWRWALTGIALLLVAGAVWLGLARVLDFSQRVASLADISNGSGTVKPLFFDPGTEIWIGKQDSATRAYYDIEETFVAEDFVIVAFEVEDSEYGVFSRDSLSAIARLTEHFLTIPGVRHVRSLTHNPWIRWGTITDENGTEETLIVSDLFEGDPQTFTDEQIVERMIATIGADRTATRIGEQRVKAAIGVDTPFTNHAGEPLLLGTILSDDGATTAIQVQVLRTRFDQAELEATFEDDSTRVTGPQLSSIEQQRSSLRGIEHFLRLEKGLAVPTTDRDHLVSWIAALPPGEEQDALSRELLDPRKNFMLDADGQTVQKFHEYDREGSRYVDRSRWWDPATASDSFAPQPLSSFEYHLAGIPVFERNFQIVGVHDGNYVILMFGVITAVLFAVFRRMSGVIIPLMIVFGSIAAMLGISLAAGKLLNNLTLMSPNMLTAVGIADAIHLISAWVLLRTRISDKRELIKEVISRNAAPVFLTSLTTAVGFYSLTVSRIDAVQGLGSMVALGTLIAWVLSMTVIPAALWLVPHKGVARPRRNSLVTSFFSRERSARLVDRVLRRRGAIVITTSGVLIVALIGLSRVQVDSDYRAMFPNDNTAKMDSIWIESRLGGVGDLELVFQGSDIAPQLSADKESRLSTLALRAAGSAQGEEEFAVLSAEEFRELKELREEHSDWRAGRIGVSAAFLARLAEFEARLREEMADPDSELHVITDLLSPLDTLRKIHQVQSQGGAAQYRVPGDEDVPEALSSASLSYDDWTEEWTLTPEQDGSTLIAQYYLQYESGARPGEALWSQLSNDRTQFRMQGRVSSASTETHLNSFARIEEIARTEFPDLVATPGGDQPGATLTISGKTLLFAKSADIFGRAFVESLTIALGTITVLVAFAFRSLSLAAVSLIPNVLPIIIPLSVFGLLGIPLDGPAILVSSVALGVCVDDTIHFFTKFVRSRRAGLGLREALTLVLSEVGAAMTVTTIVLIIGFSTLLLSDFSPNYQMGMLAAVMIGLAWIADFVVTTAVLSYARDAVGRSTHETGAAPGFDVMSVKTATPRNP